MSVKGIEEFEASFSHSRAIHDRAEDVLAGGIAHDLWGTDPFPVYFERAEGPYKYDFQGNRFVDFWLGHGAHLCGHGFDPVIAAVEKRLRHGTHLTAPDEAQIRWAENVCSLVPSAERVRFTSSGTEATMLSLRVSRAATGRSRVMKFADHFHGWHDEAVAELSMEQAGGRHPMSTELVEIANVTDIDGACQRLGERDIAAVIMEPGGGSSGLLPWSVEGLEKLRAATRETDTVLIFDEVVSGFRCTPGGVQGLTGVTPDLTTLGKVLGGGFPGAALAGKSEIMEVFGAGKRQGANRARVMHFGTFNGNVLSATAGAAMLDAIADGSHQSQAEEASETFIQGINEAARKSDVDFHAYRSSSVFQVLIGARAHDAKLGASEASPVLQEKLADAVAVLRPALLLEGVDCQGSHGWLSSSHSEEVVAEAVAGFERAFGRVKKEIDAIVAASL